MRWHEVQTAYADQIRDEFEKASEILRDFRVKNADDAIRDAVHQHNAYMEELFREEDEDIFEIDQIEKADQQIDQLDRQKDAAKIHKKREQIKKKQDQIRKLQADTLKARNTSLN